MWLGARVLFWDPPHARELYEEAVSVGRQFNPGMADMALANMGGALTMEGEFERAVVVLTEAVERTGQAHDLYSAGVAQCFLTMASLELDRHEEARRLIDDITSTAHDSGIAMWDVWAMAFRGWLALSDGDVAAAVEQLREAVRGAFVPIQQLTILSMLTEAELLASPVEDALAICRQLAESAGVADYRYVVARADVFTARAHRRAHALARARSSAYEGLSRAHEMRLAPTVHDAIEVIAGLAADQGSDEEAVRLFAAVDADRRRTGHGRCVSERGLDIAALRARVQGFDALWQEGSALTLDEAVAYARRGRGERGRPASGWDSLTPTEARVVELVAQGHSNREIGELLFVSPRTVQSHLTRTFAKLGVSGRTELAAKAIGQGA
jgi:DNA-binding CsgD family transcriptional regulator